jgi:hypothetical protein
MEKCEICNSEFKNLKALSSHFNSKHNISSKDYYDEYILKVNGDKCFVCGNLTSFRNLSVGYLENCSIECRNKNKTINRNYWKGKKQNEITVRKRIENTNQKLKQINWEKSNLEKYGVNNPSKLDSVKNKISEGNKGKIVIRDFNWQNKIIEAKKKNGTLKHSIKTKKKISESLNNYFAENLDREKYISTSNNLKHFSGWYNGLYFRSSLELSFLVKNNEIVFSSCEKNEYKIIYINNDKQKVYYPDYTDGYFIYEIKPSKLLKYKENIFKIEKGFELYGEKYKVITEIETPYISKSQILELIETGAIIVKTNSLKVLEKYKH